LEETRSISRRKEEKKKKKKKGKKGTNIKRKSKKTRARNVKYIPSTYKETGENVFVCVCMYVL